jgi:hypothetical protein
MALARPVALGPPGSVHFPLFCPLWRAGHSSMDTGGLGLS